MRCRIIFVFTAILFCTIPIQNNIFVEGESIDFSLLGPNKMIIHQDEEKYSYVTIHNTRDEYQNFTIELYSIDEPLEAVNLPVSEVLVNNHLRQFQIGFYAPANASFGTYSAVLQISSNIESVTPQLFYLNITVAPYSNLDFWGNEESDLLVDGGIRTSVAVNITNNASLQDVVSFDLGANANWEWGWIMTTVENSSAKITMEPGTLHYVYFWIDIPMVEDAMPLSGTGPKFTLTATSSLDFETTTWDLNLKMSTFRNVSIDRSDEEIILAPGQDGRLKIDVRNNGNIANKMNISLQAIDEEGYDIPEIPASDRFNVDGWTIALFGGLEDVEIQPNATRVLEIGFQSPYEFDGDVHIQLQIFPSGAKERIQTINVAATIERTKGLESTYSSSGCLNLLPSESCTNSISITNLGNARDTYVLRQSEPDDIIDVSLPTASLTIENDFSDSFENIVFTAKNDSVAFVEGVIEIEILDDAFEISNVVRIPYKIGPRVLWNFSNVTESIDEKGMMSIQMNVRNDGNAIDGLLVQLRSSHNTEMAFIPPFIAEVEEGVENPRSFEVNEIPLGYNFTIKAWVQLPMDQSSNGTVYINTSIRSKFAPEIEFVHTSTGDYLGIPWQPEPEEEDKFTLPEFFSTSLLYLKAWSNFIVTVLISGLIIYKAVLDRNKRVEEQQALDVPVEEKATETDADWLAKFQRKEEKTDDTQQTEVPKEAFETMFRMRAQPKEVAQPIDRDVKEQSTSVLQKGEFERSKHQANQILDTIQQQGVAIPHPNNKDLNVEEYNPHRTQRHDTQNLLQPEASPGKSPGEELNLPDMIDLDEL